MKRFSDQIRSLQEGLKRSEGMAFPALDVAARIQNLTNDIESKATESSAGSKVVGANGMRKEDEAVRQHQNALPARHLKSTITDGLTTLGVNANAREATAMWAGDQMAIGDPQRYERVFIEDFSDHEQLDECCACGRCDQCGVRDTIPLAPSSIAASVQPPQSATGVASSFSCSLAVAAQDDDEEQDHRNSEIDYLDSFGQDRWRMSVVTVN
ncbi:hypothetical protein NLJ89_g6850 [Agrocybe chaxingu]|uniref:Uncharacterized protein n=1 Tax=Agrocybe chaxingu TaxID=84603 RepID=A0A9W8MSA2_9AGAR|nr:hypothetical protein NLJ89_g6850 [Agrocybe chaxingu]